MASLEYLAGFFDGEGCITLCNGGRKYNLKCICANTVKESVELFQERFGGRIHPQRRPAGKAHYKMCWKWVADSRIGESFLKEILPYLRIKRKVAELALEFMRLPLKPKGRLKNGDSRLLVKEEIQKQREHIVSRLRVLNFRGIPRVITGSNPIAEILPLVVAAKEN